MTVASETASIEYEGNGGAVAFAIPYNFLSNSDIEVSQRDTAGDSTVLSTGFSITGAGTGSGTCTFTTAPASGYTILIERKPQILQPMDLVSNDSFPAETVETAHDRHAYIAQYLRTLLNRCVQVPAGDDAIGDSVVLPAVSTRKGKLLYFDETTGAIDVLDVASVSGLSSPLSQGLIGSTLYPRTTREIAAGVTPTAYHYEPGDPRRFGAGAAVAAGTNVTAIQAALDSSDIVLLPELFPVNAAVNMNDGNYFLGYGRNTGFSASHAGAVIKGKSVTTAATTNVRRYSGGGQNFEIVGPGKTTAGSIALDMRGCTMFKWWNVLITLIQTGVRQGNGYSTYYNEYHGVDLSAVTTGYSNDTLGNENMVVGGRVNDCTTGTTDSDNSHNKYIGVAIEVFTTGHEITGSATQQIQYISSRLENAPTSGTGISINANAQDTQIMFPQLIGLTTEISNSGLRTNIIASENWTLTSGTKIKKHLKVTVTKDIASLATVTARDESFTVTGVLPGDSVFVTLPAALTSSLLVGPPKVGGTDLVYLPIYNPTGSAIDPASMDFVFDVWRH